MKNSSILLVLIAVLFHFNSNAMRSMYVDDFAAILGNVTAEDELLSYSQSNGIEILLLYDLHIVNANYPLDDFATNTILADFIYKAKTNFGIVKVGAVGENGDFFTNIIQAYNDTRSDHAEQFDIYNLEFEFWNQYFTDPGGYYCTSYLIPNGLPCTNDGAFQFFFAQLQVMDQLADLSFHPITTEAYVGWPTVAQTTVFGFMDRVLVHAYVSDANDAYAYANDRLADIASTNGGSLEVSIIFSTEPAFMQSWLENNSMSSAETIFYTDWQDASISWANNIDLVGFTYFAYGFNANITVGMEEASHDEQIKISPNPVLDILTIGSTSHLQRVEIYDHLGQLVLETSENAIDVSDLSNGVYFIHVLSDQDVEVIKMVKE